MTTDKQEVITFKVPESFKEALKGIPNRSEFIRGAILAALDNVCPLCKGTGILLPNQKQHWEQFAKDHHMEECSECNARHLVCGHESQAPAHEGVVPNTDVGTAS
ncbi:MAG: ribbon-helix-helix domain-containing protein [Thermodesulfobacteriota bacterium]